MNHDAPSNQTIPVSETSHGMTPMLAQEENTSETIASNSQESTTQQPDMSMPVLEDLMAYFKLQYGDDFSGLPHREDTLFIFVQQGLPTIQPMMEAFWNKEVGMGLPKAHTFVTTKPHTTPPNMKEYFEANLGHRYVAFKFVKAPIYILGLLSYAITYFSDQYIPCEFAWLAGLLSALAYGLRWLESRCFPYAWFNLPTPLDIHESLYERLSKETSTRLLDVVSETLFKAPNERKIRNIIACDEGGRFLSKLMTRYEYPDPRYKDNFKNYEIIAVEHTTCGTRIEELRRLDISYLNMAESYLKTSLEARLIANSMYRSMKKKLSELVEEDSCFGVIGCGHIGEQALGFLLKDYPNVRVLVHDNDPGRVGRLKAEGTAKKDSLPWEKVEEATLNDLVSVSYTHLTLPTNREV